MTTLDQAQVEFRDSPCLLTALTYANVAQEYFLDGMIGWETADAAYVETTPIIVGSRMWFDYPHAFVTLPDYTAHRDQLVTVTARDYDCDEENAPMFKVTADDGWTGTAWLEELVLD